MDPLPPTPWYRLLATLIGIGAGIAAQILFQFIVTNVIGPIPDGFNIKLLEWVLLLLAPPVLSFLFIRIAPGSVADDFFKALQLGAILWFLKILISALIVLV